jgi:predicted ATP-grasp superfamily ATP-dependent carboligase
METKNLQDFKLKDIVLISALPDMGKVGGLVTSHLAKTLNTKVAAKLILTDKPWIQQKNGLIDIPFDEYSLSVNEEKSIVVFTGKNQPQEPQTVFDMARSVLSLVSKMGNIKLVISAGGYLPIEEKDNDAVYGVATNSKSLEILKSVDVKALGSDVNSITWFNGLILGQAKKQGIDGIGLFGEISDSNSPQHKAAGNIVKKIGKILGMEINTSELEDKVVKVSTKIKKEGPGIG